MRINKYLALCGLGARRKVEELVTTNRVKVNGRLVVNLATDIKEGVDIVEVDGVVVKTRSEYSYYMLNKPKGYVTTMSDEFGRRTVMDLIADIPERVFPVGRLDYDTEGLLLFTNDGELSQRLTSPKSEIEKTYYCTIEGDIKESELAVLRAGVVINGKRLNKDKGDNKTKLKIVINEGKNRQIRRMLEYIGKNITFLKRVSIANLTLGGLTRGTYRKLKLDEINYLVDLCGLSQ